MPQIWAEEALTSNGWKRNVSVAFSHDGIITSVDENSPAVGERVKILLPSPVNLHSHTFQRAMAGMSERRGPQGSDNFWTWRHLMFRFVGQLSPDDVASISAYVQMEMLEAGFAASCEFHYLHHQPDGTPYDNIAIMAEAVISAACHSGIGLTLLPVLYQFGGCDGRPLTAGQIRFGNTPDRFLKLFEAAEYAVNKMENYSNIGVAPHSLRATDAQGLDFAAKLAPGKPVHIHLAEQVAEVEEVSAHLGKRPVEWLLENQDVDDRWCLIHLTHMTAEETMAVAKSRAVAGLCPLTESSLGDGIFNGREFLEHGGQFGIGSDSNISISLSGELRALEYSQRLRDRARAVMASGEASTGRTLFEGAAKGGAQAAGRNSGALEAGKLADMIALDQDAIDLFQKQGDEILDSFIFAGSDRMVLDVWSAGCRLVQNGRHFAHEAIEKRYRSTLASLRSRI